MEVRFPFERRGSSIFGTVFRPVACFDARTKGEQSWVTIRAIVDTGADYTLLPRAYARLLGVDLERDCSTHATLGIGGQETVFLLEHLRVRMGTWEGDVPVGFLDRDTVPALLGRQHFLEAFLVIFDRHETIFRIS